MTQLGPSLCGAIPTPGGYLAHSQRMQWDNVTAERWNLPLKHPTVRLVLWLIFPELPCTQTADFLSNNLDRIWSFLINCNSVMVPSDDTFNLFRFIRCDEGRDVVHIGGYAVDAVIEEMKRDKGFLKGEFMSSSIIQSRRTRHLPALSIDCVSAFCCCWRRTTKR